MNRNKKVMTGMRKNVHLNPNFRESELHTYNRVKGEGMERRRVVEREYNR